MNTPAIKPRPLATLLLASIILLPTLVLGADPDPATPDSAGAATREQESPTPAQESSRAAPLSPMTTEIEALLSTSRLQVAVLQEQFDLAPDDNTALGLIRRIEQIKKDTEIDLLRLQLRYAQAAGDARLADEINAALTQMTTPRPRGIPVERTAPDTNTH